jgi:pSer/pThr/pTyr-binding forkhead associated (FHA) protein
MSISRSPFASVGIVARLEASHNRSNHRNNRMARLIFIHDSGERIEYQLRPGRNSIGRAADNDLAVDHESVSDYHCEVQLAPGGIMVRDLGSPTGTWIDALRIDQGNLGAGQTLQVGDIQLLLEAPAPIRVRAASASEPEVNRAETTLPPSTAGDDWMHCPKCAQWYEPGTTSQRRVGAALLHFCPQCGCPCDTGTASAAGATGPEAMTFRRGVTDALNYPVRGNGWGLLLAGTVALTLTTYAALLASFVPLLGLLALIILTIGVGGYLFAFLKHVLTSSAQGDDLVPGWPEVSSPAEFASNFFQLVGMLLFCFGPALLWARLAPDNSGIWIPFLLLGVGAFYFPMALMGVALADSLAGLNPFVVVPSMLRIFRQYLVVCALMVCLVAVQIAGEQLVELVPLPILPVFVMNCVSLYLVIVIGRVLGLLYFVNRERLAWLR